MQTRAAKGLKAKFKLLATGTPVENSLADFWCLMDTACPGYLDSYQTFRQNYITPILQAAGDEIDRVRGTLGGNFVKK
ncbi:SNF2-related protein [Paraglaciecola sp. Hal342]